MAHSKLYVRIMNSARWRATRNQYIAEHPICERCKANGYVTASRCVHHLIPIETGRDEAHCIQLAFSYQNLQALCYQCHAEVHKEERSHSKEVHKQRTQQRLQQWEARQRAKQKK